ncbi:MAG TPA: NfeD family protein [Polyangia bacterium]|nr:NfeD family protein [Polyangia bacterium]
MRALAAVVALLLLQAAPAPAGSGGRVVEIEIDGEIDLGLAPFVERELASAGASDLVILHVNTFGGRVDAAVRIRDALLRSRARTVAYIDHRAISAGALISLACDTIAMTTGATIGAATPVQLQGGEMKPVEAKVVSYMRKEMKATAEARHRSGEVAEAMVDSDVVVPGLNEKGKLLTLTTEEALRVHVADFQVDSETALLERLGRAGATVERPGLSWAERVASFLSSPVVSGLLMTLGLLGILIELYSPGHSLAGGVGLLLLLLFFFGHLVVKLAGFETLLLFGIGVALLVFEIFAAPGHIVPGVLGVVCILGSLVLAFLDLRHVPLDVQWHAGAVKHALAVVATSLVSTALLGALAIRALPQTRFGRSLVLKEAIAGAPADSAPQELLGREGRALTPLRPAGKAELAGVRVDVVADGDFVDIGEAVRVVRVEGMKVVVRRA